MQNILVGSVHCVSIFGPNFILKNGGEHNTDERNEIFWIFVFDSSLKSLYHITSYKGPLH